MASGPSSEIQMVRPEHNSGFHVRRTGNSAATRWTIGIERRIRTRTTKERMKGRDEVGEARRGRYGSGNICNWTDRCARRTVVGQWLWVVMPGHDDGSLVQQGQRREEWRQRETRVIADNPRIPTWRDRAGIIWCLVCHGAYS